MSTVPFGDPAGQYNPWLSIEYLEHVVPDGATVVNYSVCKLCEGKYLADSAGSGICGRQLCRATREAWAKADGEQKRLSEAARELLA